MGKHVNVKKLVQQHNSGCYRVPRIYCFFIKCPLYKWCKPWG